MKESGAKKITIAFLLAFFLTAGFPQKSFAGAWTVPQFRVWTEIYMKAVWSKHDINEKSDMTRKANDARSWSYEIEPKLEFGVTNWLNLLFSFSYTEAFYKEYSRPPAWGPYSVKNNGIKSITYGGKLRILRQPVVASVQLKIFQYPGYDNPQPGGEVAGQPSLGRGDDALEIRGLIGKSFELPLFYENWKLPCYVGVESGYRWRNRDVANDIPFFAEGGFWPFKWLLLKAEIDGYKGHPGTGIVQSYAIWRVGGVIQIFGTSQFRESNVFNIEAQYGQTFWGKGGSSNTNLQGSVVDAGQEIVIKVQHQF